jgi:hypothetical protein
MGDRGIAKTGWPSVAKYKHVDRLTGGVSEDRRTYWVNVETRLGEAPYPSIFRLVGSFPSGIVASHSLHCCITVSFCVPGDLL